MNFDADAFFRQQAVDLAKTIRERLTIVGFQMTSWILLGNAAGLTFVLSALKDGIVPDAVPIRFVYATFFVGMIASFAGLLRSVAIMGKLAKTLDDFVRHSALARQREDMTEDLAAKGIKPPEDWKALDEADMDHTKEAMNLLPRMQRKLQATMVIAAIGILALAIGFGTPWFFL